MMYGVNETGGLVGFGAGLGASSSLGGPGIHVVSHVHTLPYTGVHVAALVFGAITLIFLGISLVQLARRKRFQL